MKILIAGAGHLGTHLTRVLAAAGNQLTVIDEDEARLADLPAAPRARAVLGDACSPGVLEEADAHNSELLIAATGGDEDNLVISLLAKSQFAVPRVVARVNDPDNEWLFDHSWGVDVAVSPTVPLISLIEEATGASDTVTLLRLATAGINVIETTIAATSRAAGRHLADLGLPPGSLVAAVIRDGRPSAAQPDLRLQAGDELLVVSDHASDEDIRAVFQ